MNPLPPRELLLPVPDPRPLIAHVLYRFDTGGLENGVVNLLNLLPPERYRHVVIALTEVTDFRLRVKRSDVEFVALHKPPGHGLWQYPALYRLFKRLRPAIVHSRNLAALEVSVPAWAAGVPICLHGEHGRDLSDLDGSSKRYQRVRRIYSPFVHRYVALSQDLAHYLTGRVGIASSRIVQIYNGVDSLKFKPAEGVRPAIAQCPFSGPELLIFGTVGRMQGVKDQTTLAQAFVHALQQQPGLRSSWRLAMAGDGELRPKALAILAQAGMADLAYLPGERVDVADWMRGLDVFVLPSLAEGVSNTILEAMASGLPVIATRVGGNAELVEQGRTGLLVEAGDVQGMAQAMLQLGNASGRALASEMGRQGRQAVEQRFSMQAMLAAYQRLYDEALRRSSRQSLTSS